MLNIIIIVESSAQSRIQRLIVYEVVSFISAVGLGRSHLKALQDYVKQWEGKQLEKKGCCSII